MPDLKKHVEKILINYTDEIVEELTEHFSTLSKYPKKSAILVYLREKYNIIGCPARGQRNYWKLRGFNTVECDELIKPYSSVYSTFSISSIQKRYGLSIEDATKIQDERKAKAKATYELKTPDELAIINRKKASSSIETCKRVHGDKWKEVYEFRKIQKSDNVSLSGFIKRYGEEQGNIKYQEFCKGTKKQNTLKGYIERYGEIIGEKEYEKTRLKKQRAHNIIGYIERYGLELGKQKYDRRQAKYNATIKERYKGKAYEELCAKKGFTYTNAVLKYGEDKAHAMFSKRQSKVSRASKESLKILIPFYKYLRKSGIEREDIFIGINGSSEYFIRENNNFVLYDFTVKSKRFIIEFNGVTWHAREGNLEWKSPHGLLYEDSINRDKLKREMAERKGFKIITLWSDHTYKSNLDKAIKEYESHTNNIQ